MRLMFITDWRFLCGIIWEEKRKKARAEKVRAGN